MSRSARHRVAYLLGPERLELRDLPLPLPGPGEVLLRVEAAVTCGTDLKVYMRGGHPRMLRPPCPFGHEVAGVLAAIGEGVEPWRPGDRVAVANSAPCGTCPACAAGRENLCADLQYLNGAFADHLLIPPRFVGASLHRLPVGLAPEAGALAEPLACVLHAIGLCPLVSRSDVLVLGAGPLGLLFVQRLAMLGHRVTLADPHPERLALGSGLGATATAAVRRKGGAASTLRGLASGAAGYDVAVDASGVPAAWGDAVESVRPGGTVVFFGGCAPGSTLRLDTARVHYGELTLRGSYHYRPADYRRALALLGAGAVASSSLLTAERPLAELEEALRAMARRQALKVVIRP